MQHGTPFPVALKSDGAILISAADVDRLPPAAGTSRVATCTIRKQAVSLAAKQAPVALVATMHVLRIGSFGMAPSARPLDTSPVQPSVRACVQPITFQKQCFGAFTLDHEVFDDPVEDLCRVHHGSEPSNLGADALIQFWR